MPSVHNGLDVMPQLIATFSTTFHVKYLIPQNY